MSASATSAPSGAVVTTDQVRAELLAQAPDGVQPGKTGLGRPAAGTQPEWHTYWKNSGDSGLPTLLEWTLPAGVTAGDIAWPTPKKIPIGTLANYGYEGTVLLPVPLTIAPDFKPATLSDDLKLNWPPGWSARPNVFRRKASSRCSIPTRSSTACQRRAFDAASAQPPKPAGTRRQPA